MNLYTTGLRHYKDFQLPLCYSKNLEKRLPKDYLKIIILTSGTLCRRGGDTDQVILAPAVIWISSETIQDKYQKQTDESEIHTLTFHPQALKEESPTAFFFQPFTGSNEQETILEMGESSLFRIEELLVTLHKALNTQELTDLWPCLSRSYFMEILILLQRFLYTRNQPELLEYPKPSEKLQPIIQYIFNHYHTPLQLEELASRFGTNRTTLNRQFQENLKTSPMEFIQTLRFTISSGMLTKTLLPVNDIAHRVGYEDPSYFGRFFKKRAGVSPKEYRESHPYPY